MRSKEDLRQMSNERHGAEWSAPTCWTYGSLPCSQWSFSFPLEIDSALVWGIGANITRR